MHKCLPRRNCKSVGNEKKDNKQADQVWNPHMPEILDRGPQCQQEHGYAEKRVNHWLFRNTERRWGRKSKDQIKGPARLIGRCRSRVGPKMFKAVKPYSRELRSSDMPLNK